MIPELGHFALILALLLALAQSVLPLVGAQRGVARLVAVARPAAQGQFVFVALAIAALGWSFAQDDFSVLYVASHSNSALPLQYKITAIWGSHEGSMLLWAFILAGWTVAVTLFSRHLPEEVAGRVIGVMGLVSVGFLLFILFTSNPFQRLLPAAADGRDLNPLLQDPGMVIHPPMLYMGYVGFSVAFAFAVAALLGGRLDAAWARWSRPWTTVAWMFLTLGIMLGSWWAYYELGWGGWWFWDPVENASFMPWLVGTALVHSLAVTEKRQAFRSWTVLLAIFAFSLSLLGTFLVRSGVLTSVHAFATDPRRGLFILGLLVLVVGGSLTLFAWRAPRVGLGGGFGLLSRESLLLTNNVFLAVAAASVLLGTLYPLVLDALGLGKISVGPPYFETVFVPLMVPVLVLMGVGPLVRWKQHEGTDLLRRLAGPAVAALAAGVVTPWLGGRWSPMIALGLALAFWILLATGYAVLARGRSGAGLRSLPTAFWGMVLAHAGVGVFVIGVTLVSGYQGNTEVRMRIGDSADLAGYAFRFDDAGERRGPNFLAARGSFSVTRDGARVALLHPEKRTYLVQKMPMTESAIDTGVTRDLYLALGEALEDGSWIVRIWYKPFVVWIWGGCLLMAFGALLAASDRRYRRLTARGVAGSEVPKVVPPALAVPRPGEA